MPSEFVAFLRDLVKAFSKFQFRKLDKHQTFNGIVDVLATIGFVVACIRVQATVIPFIFAGWLIAVLWCAWMCFRFSRP